MQRPTADDPRIQAAFRAHEEASKAAKHKTWVFEALTPEQIANEDILHKFPLAYCRAQWAHNLPAGQLVGYVRTDEQGVRHYLDMRAGKDLPDDALMMVSQVLHAPDPD